MKIESLEDAKSEVKERMKDKLYLAIESKETGKVICEIFSHAEETDPSNKVLDTYSPCWMLNPNEKCKDYGYESAHAYIDYLFKNEGARQEELFKEFVSFVNECDGNPIYENTYQYAILKKNGNRKLRSELQQSCVKLWLKP